MTPSYPCPCCGYLVFDESPGSYGICPICGWEDDAVQLGFAKMAGGANGVSLMEAQKIFANFGSSNRPLRPRPKPAAEFKRDPDWRPLNEQTDNILEEDDPDWSYPSDGTCLYYWRSSYRRKKST